MAYLEQSTRYIPYTDRPGGRWRYHVPEELDALPALRERYVATLDAAFETYARWLPRLQTSLAQRFPRDPSDSEGVYRASIRAKALDSLRGLLPAATLANVGLYGTAQAYEALLLRLRGHPLKEARTCGDRMLRELNKVIPAFLRRVEVPDRGGAWSRYLRETREATESVARRVLVGVQPEPRAEVMLTDFDPEGELKVVASALYSASDVPDDQLQAIVRKMSAEDREAVLRAYVGERENRRHKPGRAFERTAYRFDVLTDYGAFRDLQRHRLLTLEWQLLSPAYGYTVPDAVCEAGGREDWRRVMESSADLYGALVAAGRVTIASYAVCMAYRVRFYMDMNAREAMHVIELRTAPQGHTSYRRVCLKMYRLIQQHHPAIAATMRHVHGVEVPEERLEGERLERLAEERRTDVRRGVLEELTSTAKSTVQHGPVESWGGEVTFGRNDWRVDAEVQCQPAEAAAIRTFEFIPWPVGIKSEVQAGAAQE
jgi:thymidylate synthase ThyX